MNPPAPRSSLPPYVFKPGYGPEGLKLWEGRDRFLPAYKRCHRQRLGLTENAVIFANILEGATRGAVQEFAGPGLLPESLGREVEEAHQRLAPGTARPPTADDWDVDTMAQRVSEVWAAGVLSDPAATDRFAPWVPEARIPKALPPQARTGALKMARGALARRCWPMQVTLEQSGVVTLYQELVAPLRSVFRTLAEYLEAEGYRPPADEVDGLVKRWRAARYQRVRFSFVDIRRELRAARQRAT